MISQINFYDKHGNGSQNFKVFDEDNEVIAVGQTHHINGVAWVISIESNEPAITFTIAKKVDFDPERDHELNPTIAQVAQALGINQDDDRDLPTQGEIAREAAYGDRC